MIYLPGLVLGAGRILVCAVGPDLSFSWASALHRCC